MRNNNKEICCCFILIPFRIAQACKSRGVKLCGVLTAAMLLAAVSSKHLPAGRSENYTVITMIDCRKFLDPRLDSLDLGMTISDVLFEAGDGGQIEC